MLVPPKRSIFGIPAPQGQASFEERAFVPDGTLLPEEAQPLEFN